MPPPEERGVSSRRNAGFERLSYHDSVTLYRKAFRMRIQNPVPSPITASPSPLLHLLPLLLPLRQPRLLCLTEPLHICCRIPEGDGARPPPPLQAGDFDERVAGK